MSEMVSILRRVGTVLLWPFRSHASRRTPPLGFSAADARMRAAQMTEGIVEAHQFERVGKMWVLRNLHTGSAMPVEVGDILFLAHPSIIPEGLDGNSFGSCP